MAEIEKVESIYTGNAGEEIKIWIITNERLVDGTFGSKYAKKIVQNIMEGMTPEDATTAAKAGINRLKTIEFEEIVNVHTIEGFEQIKLVREKAENGKKETFLINIEQQEDRLEIINTLEDVCPTLKYEETVASTWEAIQGLVIGLVVYAILAGVLVFLVSLDPAELQNNNNRRAKAQLIGMLALWLQNTIGLIGVSAIAAIIGLMIVFYIFKGATNPPVKHELR